MFHLTIETDNAAFGDTPDETGAEVARILADVARRLKLGTPDPETFARIRDANGNHVGGWRFTESAEAVTPLEALKLALAFMEGFEGDELQEGIDARLRTIRATVAALEVR